jgi:hypothetical protein
VRRRYIEMGLRQHTVRVPEVSTTGAPVVALQFVAEAPFLSE